MSAGVPSEPSMPNLESDPRLGEILVSEEVLHARIRELGADIARDYAGEVPLLVCVLKGAFVFMADITRAIDLPVEVDFMAVSSYGSSTKSSGVVRIVKDLDIDLLGRHVLLIEDIVDSGLTLNFVLKNLQARGPASLEVCALFVKQVNQKVAPELKYVGFDLPDEFVIGYGLDVAERYRNLNHLRVYRS